MFPSLSSYVGLCKITLISVVTLMFMANRKILFKYHIKPACSLFSLLWISVFLLLDFLFPVKENRSVIFFSFTKIKKHKKTLNFFSFALLEWKTLPAKWRNNNKQNNVFDNFTWKLLYFIFFFHFFPKNLFILFFWLAVI